MRLLRSSPVRLALSILLTLAAAPALAHSQDPAACRIRQVTTLPGSHLFDADFIEAFATDPESMAPHAPSSSALFALTADLNPSVPPERRALYISRSTNGGATWTPIARIAPRYFNARISEGLRNSLIVAPGATDFVVTTQLGAFQVISQSHTHADPSAPVIIPIAGPRVPDSPSPVTIAKKPGDPIRAGVALITADGRRLVIAYGYFDDNPQLITYHRGPHRAWVLDGTLPHLPSDLDIFSMQFDDPANPLPGSLYVGTGDQAYRLDLSTNQWTRIAGVGPDSAIHSISTVAGLHLAACWGVYTPVTADSVRRVTAARFLLHRGKDQVGPNIRAYAIAVDPRRPNREVLAVITGVYTSSDSGQSWRRLNDLPEGEFHSAHFNPDGSVLVSGYPGTFLTNPFSPACSPRLKTRER